MKVPVLLVPVCLFLFFCSFGCSRDDEPSGLPPSPKVVQAIKPFAEPKEAKEAEENKNPELSGDEKPAWPHDKPQPETMDLAAQEQSSADKPDLYTDGKPKIPEPERLEDPEPGVYIVTKGDTLTKIAARQEILKDPLKWLILLQLNLDKLDDRSTGADIAVRELPEGMKLRFITPGEAKKEVKKPSGPVWAVNVISGAAMEEIVNPAVILTKKGYPAYITRAHVKGKEYLRLRVGFFGSKSEAREQGDKIKKILGFKDSWATRVDGVEYEEVAGLLKTP
ncbi:MAG: SPOR domain-containing protein [Deltaproteobacteria bacterium]|nr:SPOR domain-containing protein [Deltaproteobacteria bacterium]